MKTIKSAVIFFLMTSLFCSFNEQANAQPNESIYKKTHARRAIQKTRFVLMKARTKVSEGKMYTGNLAKAISHQRLAKKLYLEEKYEKAIHHARRARMLAIMAIKANKGTPIADMEDSSLEKDMAKGSPSDEQLDKELSDTKASDKQKDEDISDADIEDSSLKDNQ
jgi:hypothetical protein